MYRIFSPDGKLYRLISLFTDSLYLTILWAVCSLPVITAGAATTALYRVCILLIREEEQGLTRTFFSAFRENFRFSTKVWSLLLALGCVLAFDGYVFYHMRFSGIFWVIAMALYLVVLAAYCIVMLWIFPLMAMFRNSMKQMLKNAIMIGMHFLMCTACMSAVFFAMTLFIVRFFTPALLFGQGLSVLISCWLCNRVLLLCAEKAQEEQNA